MEKEKPTNPLMQQFDGQYASDSYAVAFKYPKKSYTLRDHFAGLAMQGLISATDKDGNWTGNLPKNLSENAYSVADAMLKQREL